MSNTFTAGGKEIKMATWKIVQLDRKTADGFVTTAHWDVTLTDGEYSARAYGACGFDGELTTPYENLTEAQVLEWVWANGVDKAATEASLAAQIEAQKNPVSATGVPWVNNGA
jgi:hypothetical protein